MDKNSKIWVAGATGLVGSALVRELTKQGYSNVITDRIDLINQQATIDFFKLHKPDYVFLVAGKVGGISANNSDRAEFIYQNTMIAANTIHAAHRSGVNKLLYVGSSCIYPCETHQPIKENQLLTGSLEPTNEPYAVAKICGIKLCESYKRQYNDNFISAIPCNSYGLNDNYDYQSSHVLPAIIRHIIEAKQGGRTEIQLWGTGKPRREFIYVDDMADGLIFLMNNYDGIEPVNVGTGYDISIQALAELVKQAIGWKGTIKFNGLMDGMMEKRMDVSKLSGLGWQALTSLEHGIEKTINNIDKSKW